MAQVSTELHQSIDRILERSCAAWRTLPEVEVETDEWDWVDHVVYIEEWPIEEDRLTDLERYAACGAMDPAQLARYEELKGVVARNRPIIRRLQES